LEGCEAGCEAGTVVCAKAPEHAASNASDSHVLIWPIFDPSRK
jgi:hypothetical protein